MALVKEFEHLKISLDMIKLATNSFGSDHFIGVGGFGKVYKGEIPERDGRPITVAIKQLDRNTDKVDMSFSDEADEKILVYKYELNGSLEKYLNSNTLTCVQRLKICVGAARGLEYLLNPLETQQRVLHRDVKSANVLLDQFWEAKVSDFGLSRLGPTNQEFLFLVSNVVGTPGTVILFMRKQES
ncbi:putative protein kinase RLK-Pelle-CrRLK1L-1 family [Helianthus annuus]|uniref:Protein kinase domain-containing protein n=2 Tax=Helianthus annuus TaxID=4232 RepID=A0A9K3IRM4_HELAN|nr:putative protein kinase RLK-Pelle-CrRLK1L-1 family [Helianthus annuus]KAJ0566249.1 putative protein kinase RLK-Pelle-CrRLK1L-1 family [Helianthus annuus]KAJ0573040.1 putative protein kinase RLK-Pelle-CrRLK1L-1 family [Helianthus annuus]KAJ0737471.1 putative protein kinase RLK-Pelle-CrRLK1L-1 family [Helianthus annuus]KAJ0803433.1 putative protein kinase RLK-Pelle-CrRLK1L-1 family [Helianthus annuus]